MNVPDGGVVGLPGSLDCPDDPEDAVIHLYRMHVLGLTRLAVVMLGDRPAAEDVVQDAFCGLYTHWRRFVRSRQGPALPAVIGAQRLPQPSAPLVPCRAGAGGLGKCRVGRVSGAPRRRAPPRALRAATPARPPA